MGLRIQNNQHNPISPFLGIYPRDIIIDESKELCARIFFTELDIRAKKKKKKQAKFPMVEE